MAALALEEEIYLHSLKKVFRKTKSSLAINSLSQDTHYFSDSDNFNKISAKKAKLSLQKKLKRAIKNHEFRDIESGLFNTTSLLKPNDWYINLETNEIEWFDGSFEIIGYKRQGFDMIETYTDAYNNRTQTKYDGKTKSSYLYNSETAKFNFLKNYDNDHEVVDKITPYINAPSIVIDQFSGALVNGFQMSGIALYEGIVNGRELDGLKFDSLGYKPALDIEKTYIFNNGKWVEVNVHAHGTMEFAKTYTSNLLKIIPFKANLVKNKLIDGVISSKMKKELKEYIEGL